MAIHFRVSLLLLTINLISHAPTKIHESVKKKKKKNEVGGCIMLSNFVH